MNEAPTHGVRVLCDVGELDAVRALWESSQHHPLADYEFFQTIAAVRSEHSRPLVIVVYRGDRPVTLLVGRIDQESRPLRLGYARLGSYRLTQLRFIAGGLLGESTTARAALLVEAVAKLMRERSISSAVFEQMSDAHVLHQALVDGFGRWRHSRVDGETRHWQLGLPGTWDEFMQARGSKHRYWLKRLSRKLESDYAGRWQIERCSSPEHASRFLIAAESVAAKSYHRALNVGFRHDAEFSQRIMLDARRHRLQGYLLTIDDQACAFWYCVVYGKTIHLMATAYDPQFQRYEPGTVLLMRVFRDHCGTETRLVDFGLGDAGYKQRFGTVFELEGPTTFFAGTARGLALHAFLAGLRRAKSAARALLDALDATQRVKTLWRRRMAGPRRETDAPVVE